MLCLEASTGAEIWRRAIRGKVKGPECGAMSTPTLDVGFVYALTPDAILSRIDAAKGEVRWELNLINDFGCNVLAQVWLSPGPHGMPFRGLPVLDRWLPAAGDGYPFH